MRSSAELHCENEKGDLRVPFFQLAGFLDPVTLQALRTHPNPFHSTVDTDAHRLQVRIPAPLGAVVRVTDVVAGNRPFCADGAYPCHKLHPVSCTNAEKPLNLVSIVA